MGWDLQPGGVWHGGYIVADEEDLFNGIERLVVVIELRDPEEIVFPFQGAHLKDAWPVMAEEPGSGAPKEKGRRKSTRPDYIDSKSWQKLQYPTRLKIAEDERLRREREAGGDAASGTGVDASGDGLSATHPPQGEVADAQADPNVADLSEFIVACRASASQPVIIEFCCAPDSEVGKVDKVRLRGESERPGCRVIRISKEDCDLTTSGGARKALSIACENPGALLLTSLPCTAGCPFWNLNIHRPGGKARLREHKRQLRLMLEAWRPVAWTVRELGGCIAWEWPRDCALWKAPGIQEIVQEYALEHARFDGCSYGVKCRAGRHKGLPIHKPWSIVTDCSALWRRFSGKCCP